MNKTVITTLALALAAPWAGAQTLDKVKVSGSIAVAYRESSIPFSYLDDKRNPRALAGRSAAASSMR